MRTTGTRYKQEARVLDESLDGISPYVTQLTCDIDPNVWERDGDLAPTDSASERVFRRYNRGRWQRHSSIAKTQTQRNAA